MEIVLVRHALPVRIDATPDGAPADPGLAELGVEQAGRVADALRHDKIDALYTSPSRRAVETAAPLAGALGMEPIREAGIREFDAADPSYVPVEELRASNDPRWHRLVAGDLYTAAVDPAEFRGRVVEAVERIAALHPGGRAVLVTHSGSINAYSGHVLGQQRAIWFAPAYCSITRIAIARTGRKGIVSLNETGHVRDLI
ncbi:MAG: 2,3-bisphosphoglycerate-dependent phosphoglycerate mutase [Actinomycetota bacterium]|jgi:broad specificity phosphatase PhoE|nr:2,3-bisphosphoglycerate-dependent phosphoglycerate mutase [Actinomycetota bacterium]